MINIEEYTKLLIDFKISPEQFILIRILIFQEYALIYKYSEELSPFNEDGIDDLLNKKYIKYVGDSNKGLHNDNLTIEENFKVKLFERNPELMFELYWNKYPNFSNKESKRISLKTVNYENLKSKYIKFTSQNLQFHEYLMTQLKFDIKEELIVDDIDQYWTYLAELSKQDLKR